MQVPSLPRDRVTALDAADQLRLEGEREAALAAEAEQRKVGGCRWLPMYALLGSARESALAAEAENAQGVCMRLFGCWMAISACSGGS